MKLKVLFTFLSIASVYLLSALDRDLSYDITALHQSKLVVTASVHPGKDREYKITINQILKKVEGITLAIDDKIKLMVPEWGSFGTEQRVYESEYIFYLTPHEKRWLSVFGEQHIRALENNLIPFDVCERTFYLNPTEYRQMASDMAYCFTYKNDYQYSIKRPFSKYKAERKPMIVVRELYKCHDNLINVQTYIDEPEPFYPDLEMPDTTIYNFCETQQGLMQTPEEFAQFMTDSIPMSISNNEFGIQGKIYIGFVIEPDSSGSNYKVARGIHPTFDAFAIELVKKMAPYKPGLIRGEAVRSQFYIPITIRMQ